MAAEDNLPIRSTIPTSELLVLDLEDILPSVDNPRQLFDPEPLEELKESIEKHGLLVPITVHLPEGSLKYRILDGERRYRCCQLLKLDGKTVEIKANVVQTPTRLSGLLAMFSIHNYREGWELMPTALSLKDVIEELNEESADNARLHELTGLSVTQIERCRKLMDLPVGFQLLSLDLDPRTRIPSNFWIEAKPVEEVVAERLPEYYEQIGGRNGLLTRLCEKYRRNAIKSVIHFRRIMEAFTLPSEEDSEYGTKIARATERLHQWLENVDYETRAAFDGLTQSDKLTKKATQVCTDFRVSLGRLKIEYSVDGRDDLLTALNEVRSYVDELIEKLSGRDEPLSLFDDEGEDLGGDA